MDTKIYSIILVINKSFKNHYYRINVKYSNKNNFFGLIFDFFRTQMGEMRINDRQTDCQ